LEARKQRKEKGGENFKASPYSDKPFQPDAQTRKKFTETVDYILSKKAAKTGRELTRRLFLADSTMAFGESSIRKIVGPQGSMDNSNSENTTEINTVNSIRPKKS
jgi:hypothetical protein